MKKKKCECWTQFIACLIVSVILLVIGIFQEKKAVKERHEFIIQEVKKQCK